MFANKANPMGRVAVEVVLANKLDMAKAREGTIPEEQVRQVRITGIVDTGATRLVIPQSAADALGCPSAGTSRVRYADNSTATRPLVGLVSLTLLGREGTFKASVEPHRTTALIGAIVMEDLDLLVDCASQTIYPRDPDMIVSEVEGFDE